MLADLRSLVSGLKFRELRMSEASVAVRSSDRMRELRVAHIELNDVDLQTSRPCFRAVSLELSNVTVRSPSWWPSSGRTEGIRTVEIEQMHLKQASVGPCPVPIGNAGNAQRHWQLEPLRNLEGTLHADIVDAAWIFDADVTIPISDGCIDFNRATVEHIGPDSSMGVSRMGVYVDAPNGRTYLFMLSATHVPGAHFEQRSGGLLPGWRGDRGSIELRPLLECALSGMPLGRLAAGTRDMLSRTRMSGEFRLGDGVIGDDQHRIVLVGRERGKNHVALSSAESGTGIVLRTGDLAVAEVHWRSSGAVVSAKDLRATMSVQLNDAASEPHVSLNIAELTLDDVSVIRNAALAGS
jgi:hypothetical protein